MSVRHFAIGMAMILTAIVSVALSPTQLSAGLTMPELEGMVPKQFGEWKLAQSIIQTNPAPETYGAILTRTYDNAHGGQVMLLLAYGNKQTMRLKSHWQEVCYAGSGFTISNLKKIQLSFDNKTIKATRMLAKNDSRTEPVTYWITLGRQVVDSRMERMLAQISRGLTGEILDGFLVRVSNLSTKEEESYALHESFIKALLAAMDRNDVYRIAGGT